MMSLIVLGALGLLLTTAICGVGYAIYKNTHNAEKYRNDISEKISGIRLNKMLKHLSINKQQYLHKQPINVIHQNIIRCDNCKDKPICDETLPQANENTSLDFCPNENILKNIAKMQ